MTTCPSPSCGAAVRDDEVLCLACGAVLHPSGAADEPAAVPDRRASTASAGRGFAFAGLVSGTLGLLFLPIVLGPLGVLLGYQAKQKGDPRLGQVTIVWSLAITAIGIVSGIAALS